jgi:hypothetical protein
VYQPDNIPDDDTLTAITRLGMLSSLQYTFMFKNIKRLNFQSINDNNILLTIFQICCNMHQLETMTLKFAISQTLLDIHEFDHS